MKEIVIATRNKHKYTEIVSILTGMKSKFVFAGDMDELPEIEESGDTLLENALIKARTTAQILNKPCIADDTGIFVHSLDGRPGVYSAIYAGEDSSYEENLKKLLSELSDKKDRFAYFQTITVLFDPIKHKFYQSLGEVHGHIIESPKGKNGFGYDPIFVPEFSDKTYAEMSDTEKNTKSHRYKSIRGLVKYIYEYLQEENND